MKTFMLLTALLLSAALPTPTSVYDFTMKNIDGQMLSLSEYKGKVLLIVNVASKCGLTPQYESIEALYRKYKSRGLVVLGFPANNFMGQEPGSEKEIKTFCSTKYNVSFPLFSKISVRGRDQHPLYRYLTTKKENGKLEASVKWNFQKFLIGRDGKVIDYFAPTTKVTDPDVIAAIEAALGK